MALILAAEWCESNDGEEGSDERNDCHLVGAWLRHIAATVERESAIAQAAKKQRRVQGYGARCPQAPNGAAMTRRRWHWLRRFLNAWEWACIAAIEEWFSVFSRAWQTGSGAPRVTAPPRAGRLDAWTLPAITAPVAPPLPPVPVPPREVPPPPPKPVREPPPLRIAQPRMDEAAIVGGLVKLGARKEQATKAARRALASGEQDVSGLMRRALVALTGDN